VSLAKTLSCKKWQKNTK